MKKLICGLMLLLSMTCFGQTYVEQFYNVSSIFLIKSVNKFIKDKNVKDIKFKYFGDFYYAFVIYED